MRFTASLVALAATSFVSAAPIRRAADANTVLVFQFAEVLERLETEFYGQALKKFKESDFTAAGYPSAQLPIEQFKVIKGDEETHAKFLQSGLKGLGKAPVGGCRFNFDSALTDVDTMVATARAVENVGISAYLGGATLLSDPVILDEAASILTVEARHQTVNNILSGDVAVFSAFDIPLAPNEVLAIAGAFISGCDLGIPSNHPLTITNKGTIKPGTKLTFKADTLNGSVPENKLSCQMLFGGATTAQVLPLDNCVVPEGIDGLGYVFVTSDGQPLINNARDRDSSKVLAGPAVVAVKSKSETLGSLVKNSGRGSKSSSGADSATTQTISPGEASSIIESASSTASAASGTPTASGAPAASGTPAAGNDSSNLSNGPSNGGPNLNTGKSADGSLTVDGWQNVPLQGAVGSAASAPASTPTSGGGSSGGGYGGY